MKKYRPRYADKILEKRLKAFGAVCVTGAKGVGKTTTCRQYAKSEDRLQDFIDKEALRETLTINPKVFLEGEKPHLIDEWQDAPAIWDLVRSYCDDHPEKGNFILTGSTSKKVETSHTGTMRISSFSMYPMSLYESGDSNGKVSLSSLFDEDVDITAKSEKSLDDIIYLACRGGFPGSLYAKDEEASLEIAKDYCRQIYISDMHHIDNKKRREDIMAKLLRSYARNVSTLAKKATLANDCGVDEETIDDYLDDLRRLYVIEELMGFTPNIRSAKNMRKGPKREFVDPSLAIAALGVSPKYLARDMRTFGFIFECMVIRDLRAYLSPLGGQLGYYRDDNGLEVDVVAFLEDGRYGLIEVKLGASFIEEGANNLNRLERIIIEAIDKGEAGMLIAPSFKMVITADQYGYRRPDGVYVVPLACLKG